MTTKYALPDNLSRDGFDKNGSELNYVVIEKVRKFINGCWKKTKTMNKHQSSYGLKHVAERAIGEYVGNGDLIAAMILEGYSYVNKYKLNAEFNVSQSSVKKSDPARTENELKNGYYQDIDKAICGFLEYNDITHELHIGFEKDSFSPLLEWKLIQPSQDDEGLYNVRYYENFIKEYEWLIVDKKMHYKEVKQLWLEFISQVKR